MNEDVTRDVRAHDDDDASGKLINIGLSTEGNSRSSESNCSFVECARPKNNRKFAWIEAFRSR